VIVVKNKDCGTSIMTVPTCPGRLGTIVVVVTTDPVYGAVIVVNARVCCGTCTTTVPVCPAILGKIVVVAVVDPV
jgi:hypothetical protein